MEKLEENQIEFWREEELGGCGKICMFEGTSGEQLMSLCGQQSHLRSMQNMRWANPGVETCGRDIVWDKQFKKPHPSERASLCNAEDSNAAPFSSQQSSFGNSRASLCTSSLNANASRFVPSGNKADYSRFSACERSSNVDRSLQTVRPEVGNTSDTLVLNPKEWALNRRFSQVVLWDGSLDLEFFKVFPCKNNSHVHNRKICPYFHNLRDKRRFPVSYNAEQCDDHFDLDSTTLKCLKGEQCDQCHNRHELLYHPHLYKQRFCSHYISGRVNGGNIASFTPICSRGRYCAFAHTREEIRASLFSDHDEQFPSTIFFMSKFKTLWCPYGVQHDWHSCVYAHTYQDCRRAPEIGYGSEPCPFWNKEVHSSDYEKRCPNGVRCPFSHGSKEQLYHPAYYKTMPCVDFRTRGYCPRARLCAFFHEASEKRPDPTNGDRGQYCDYGGKLPLEAMHYLQRGFLRPPLFNLDDFESFGHNSKNGRQSECNNSRKPSTQPYYLSDESEFAHQYAELPKGKPLNTRVSGSRDDSAEKFRHLYERLHQKFCKEVVYDNTAPCGRNSRSPEDITYKKNTDHDLDYGEEVNFDHGNYDTKAEYDRYVKQPATVPSNTECVSQVSLGQAGADIFTSPPGFGPMETETLPYGFETLRYSKGGDNLKKCDKLYSDGQCGSKAGILALSMSFDSRNILSSIFSPSSETEFLQDEESLLGKVRRTGRADIDAPLCEGGFEDTYRIQGVSENCPQGYPESACREITSMCEYPTNQNDSACDTALPPFGSDYPSFSPPFSPSFGDSSSVQHTGLPAVSSDVPANEQATDSPLGFGEGEQLLSNNPWGSMMECAKPLGKRPAVIFDQMTVWPLNAWGQENNSRWSSLSPFPDNIIWGAEDTLLQEEGGEVKGAILSTPESLANISDPNIIGSNPIAGSPNALDTPNTVDALRIASDYPDAILNPSAIGIQSNAVFNPNAVVGHGAVVSPSTAKKTSVKADSALRRVIGEDSIYVRGNSQNCATDCGNNHSNEFSGDRLIVHRQITTEAYDMTPTFSDPTPTAFSTQLEKLHLSEAGACESLLVSEGDCCNFGLSYNAQKGTDNSLWGSIGDNFKSLRLMDSKIAPDIPNQRLNHIADDHLSEALLLPWVVKTPPEKTAISEYTGKTRIASKETAKPSGISRIVNKDVLENSVYIWASDPPSGQEMLLTFLRGMKTSGDSECTLIFSDSYLPGLRRRNESVKLFSLFTEMFHVEGEWRDGSPCKNVKQTEHNRGGTEFSTRASTVGGESFVLSGGEEGGIFWESFRRGERAINWFLLNSEASTVLPELVKNMEASRTLPLTILSLHENMASLHQTMMCREEMRMEGVRGRVKWVHIFSSSSWSEIECVFPPTHIRPLPLQELPRWCKSLEVNHGREMQDCGVGDRGEEPCGEKGIIVHALYEEAKSFLVGLFEEAKTVREKIGTSGLIVLGGRATSTYQVSDLCSLGGSAEIAVIPPIGIASTHWFGRQHINNERDILTPLINRFSQLGAEVDFENSAWYSLLPIRFYLACKRISVNYPNKIKCVVKKAGEAAVPNMQHVKKSLRGSDFQLYKTYISTILLHDIARFAIFASNNSKTTHHNHVNNPSIDTNDYNGSKENCYIIKPSRILCNINLFPTPRSKGVRTRNRKKRRPSFLEKKIDSIRGIDCLISKPHTGMSLEILAEGSFEQGGIFGRLLKYLINVETASHLMDSAICHVPITLNGEDENMSVISVSARGRNAPIYIHAEAAYPRGTFSAKRCGEHLNSSHFNRTTNLLLTLERVDTNPLQSSGCSVMLVKMSFGANERNEMTSFANQTNLGNMPILKMLFQKKCACILCGESSEWKDGNFCCFVDAACGRLSCGHLLHTSCARICGFSSCTPCVCTRFFRAPNAAADEVFSRREVSSFQEEPLYLRRVLLDIMQIFLQLQKQEKSLLHHLQHVQEGTDLSDSSGQTAESSEGANFWKEGMTEKRDHKSAKYISHQSKPGGSYIIPSNVFCHFPLEKLEPRHISLKTNKMAASLEQTSLFSFLALKSPNSWNFAVDLSFCLDNDSTNCTSESQLSHSTPLVSSCGTNRFTGNGSLLKSWGECKKVKFSEQCANIMLYVLTKQPSCALLRTPCLFPNLHKLLTPSPPTFLPPLASDTHCPLCLVAQQEPLASDLITNLYKLSAKERQNSPKERKDKGNSSPVLVDLEPVKYHPFFWTASMKLNFLQQMNSNLSVSEFVASNKAKNREYDNKKGDGYAWESKKPLNWQSAVRKPLYTLLVNFLRNKRGLSGNSPALDLSACVRNTPREEKNTHFSGAVPQSEFQSSIDGLVRFILKLRKYWVDICHLSSKQQILDLISIFPGSFLEMDRPGACSKRGILELGDSQTNSETTQGSIEIMRNTLIQKRDHILNRQLETINNRLLIDLYRCTLENNTVRTWVKSIVTLQGVTEAFEYSGFLL